MDLNDQTYGEEWIPPLDCPECGHSTARTRVYCRTCRGPYYCEHCAGSIAENPPDPPPLP